MLRCYWRHGRHVRCSNKHYFHYISNIFHEVWCKWQHLGWALWCKSQGPFSKGWGAVVVLSLLHLQGWPQRKGPSVTTLSGAAHAQWLIRRTLTKEGAGGGQLGRSFQFQRPLWSQGLSSLLLTVPWTPHFLMTLRWTRILFASVSPCLLACSKRLLVQWHCCPILDFLGTKALLSYVAFATAVHRTCRSQFSVVSGKFPLLLNNYPFIWIHSVLHR